MKIGEHKELTEAQADMITHMIQWLEVLDKKQDNINVIFHDGVPDNFMDRPTYISEAEGVELNIGVSLFKLNRVRELGRYNYDELDILNLLRKFFYSDFKELYKSRREVLNNK